MFRDGHGTGADLMVLTDYLTVEQETMSDAHELDSEFAQVRSIEGPAKAGFSILAAVLSALLLTAESVAQTAGSQARECPDVGPSLAPQTLQTGPNSPCGSQGLEVTIGGNTYSASQGFCPTFIDMIPEHGVTAPSVPLPGHYIVVVPDAKPVLRDYNRCSGFLFWFSCKHVNGPVEIYRVDNAVAMACVARAQL